MVDAKDSLVLVTGASTGIGFELARCFADDGHGLIVVAEEQGPLLEAATMLRQAGAPRWRRWWSTCPAPTGRTSSTRRCSASESCPSSWSTMPGSASMAISPARRGGRDELRLIQLNVIAMVRLTKLFAPAMVERGSGRILITSSVAAIAPSPLQSVYSASKAFEYAFAEGIANELSDTGVTVTALMPDATETEFFIRAGMEDTKLGQASKADPADIARAGYDAMMKGKDHVIAPFTAKLKTALTAVMPERMVAGMARAD